MDYYQGVVIEYLTADRAVFVNAECCIQLNEADNPDTSGPHWYSDAVACDFRDHTIFLCEITFSTTLGALTKRLSGWHGHWDGVKTSLLRDSHLPRDWTVRPWLFVPEQSVPLLLKRLDAIAESGSRRFIPRITPLEMTQPWRFRSWSRIGELEKPSSIPAEMAA
jgi:hypothetical protein